MAGVGVEVRTEGFERLQAKLARLGAVDFTEALEQIGQTVEQQTLEHFEREADPEGRPWRGLKGSTIRRRLGGSKARKKRGGLTKAARQKLGAMKILQDSSFQGGLISTVAYQVNGDEVVIGANKVYAAIHQFGGAEVGMPQIPARPYLGLSGQEAVEVERVVEGWLGGKLKV